MRELFCTVILLSGKELFLSKSLQCWVWSDTHTVGLGTSSGDLQYRDRRWAKVEKQLISLFKEQKLITGRSSLPCCLFSCEVSLFASSPRASEHPESDRGAPGDPESLQSLEWAEGTWCYLGSDLSSKLLSPMESPVPAHPNEVQGVCISQLH